jgi:hypothetical protein
MLEISPEKRIKASEALKHKYIANSKFLNKKVFESSDEDLNVSDEDEKSLPSQKIIKMKIK